MKYSSAITCVERLGEAVQNLVPGAHLVVFASSTWAALEARKFGLTLRDTMLVYTADQVQMAFLLRNTLDAPTVAENTLKFAAGGINIEACRVSWGDEKPTQEEWNRLGAGGTGESTTAFLQHTAIRKYYAEGLIPVPTGRWPTNLVVVHGEGCRIVGVKQVSSRTCEYPDIDEGRADTSTWRFRPTEATARGYGTDGVEDVPLWSCCDSCPIPAMDGDDSRARFFPQFSNRDELLVWIKRLITPATEPCWCSLNPGG
jgi:hypothetical protein